MNKMIKTAIAAGVATAALSISTTASAQEWDGFYGGVNLGLGSLSASAVGEYGGFDSTDLVGSLGGTVGYNWGEGAAVYGIEADINAGDISTTGNEYSTEYYSYETKWNWYSTVRGRAGLAVENALFYVTGGIVAADVEATYCDAGPACTADAENYKLDEIQYGIVFGAGVDVALSEGLTVKAEFIQAPLFSTTIEREDDTERAEVESSLSTLRVGANWKF